MIILFHRPPFPENPPDKLPEDGTKQYRNFDTFSLQTADFTEGETELTIHVTAIWKRRYPLDLTFNLPNKVGGVYEIFYNDARKATTYRNFAIVNPYIPLAGLPGSNVVSVGRVHFEEGRTLVYLRSHYADIEGVENVIMTEESQTSVQAMGAYSEEAKKLFYSIMAKRDFLNEIDALDSTSYLEAQLDVLTKVVLASGIADNDELKEVLVKADEQGIWRSNTLEKLLSKMEDKKAFREKQLAYYEHNVYPIEETSE